MFVVCLFRSVWSWVSAAHPALTKGLEHQTPPKWPHTLPEERPLQKGLWSTTGQSAKWQLLKGKSLLPGIEISYCLFLNMVLLFFGSSFWNNHKSGIIYKTNKIYSTCQLNNNDNQSGEVVVVLVWGLKKTTKNTHTHKKKKKNNRTLCIQTGGDRQDTDRQKDLCFRCRKSLCFPSTWT